MHTGSDPAGSPAGAIERWLGVLSALPVAVIVALTFADVFCRYVFASPVRGSVEMIEYAMAIVIFTALPLVTRRREHVTVSLVDGLLKGAAARAKAALCDLVSAIALGLVCWRLAVQALNDLESDAATVVLGMPQAPLTFLLSALAGLSALAVLALCWESLIGKGAAQ